MESTEQCWLYFAASLGVFLIYNMLQAFCVRGRMRSALSIDHERARCTAEILLQIPAGTEEFRKEIASLTPAATVFLTLTSSLTFAAAVASFTTDKKRPASIVISLYSAFPTLCFALFLKMLDEAKPDANASLEDQRRNMEALLRKAFVLRRVGYRLFSFSPALCMGWIQSIAMFAATIVLVLIYVILDIYTVSRQITHTPPCPGVPTEDPIRAQTLHLQVGGVALLPLQKQVQPAGTQ